MKEAGEVKSTTAGDILLSVGGGSDEVSIAK